MNQAIVSHRVVLPWSIFPTAGLRPLCVHSHGKSDHGRVRKSNEDQFLIAALHRVLSVQQSSFTAKGTEHSEHGAHVYVVADGMGGNHRGDVASQIAITAVETFLLNRLRQFIHLQPTDDHDVLKEFHAAFVQVDSRLCAEAAQHSDLRGMATTLTMALVYESRAYVAHVGDSRCYLYSSGKLQRVTQETTPSAASVHVGAKQVGSDPSPVVSASALGIGDFAAEPELHQLDLQPEDVLLLCTDGLTEMVADDRIAAILDQGEGPDHTCEKLIAAANAAGGRDNITVIVARFQEAP